MWHLPINDLSTLLGIAIAVCCRSGITSAQQDVAICQCKVASKFVSEMTIPT